MNVVYQLRYIDSSEPLNIPYVLVQFDSETEAFKALDYHVKNSRYYEDELQIFSKKVYSSFEDYLLEEE